MSRLDYLVISAQSKLARAKENFKNFMKSEAGVSNVVATIIILLIVVLLIAFFWDELQKWLDGMMDQIFGTEIKDDGLTPVP